MSRRATATKGMLLLGLVVGLSLCTGCKGALDYAKYRLQDAAEIGDFGITVSAEPSFAFWLAAPASMAAGFYADTENYLIGMGGGRVGIIPHTLRAAGFLVYGWEESGWGDYDREKPETLYQTYQGIAGMPFSFVSARPAYMPTCTHEFHFGFVGVIINPRYAEMFDFFIGFTGLDLAGDDGEDDTPGGKLGSWPWQTEEEMDKKSQEGDFWPF